MPANPPAAAPSLAAWAHVVVVPPLFDEANRLRRTLALMRRRLAAQDIAAIMPDLPGQNDSMEPTEAVCLADWRTALAEIAGQLPPPVVVVSVRGGALIDDGVDAAGWWRLAPIGGDAVLRPMERAQAVSDREAGTAPVPASDGARLLAGHRLSAAMLTQLAAAQPAPVTPLRRAELDGGAAAADIYLTGTRLWLRAEPGEDAAMAAAMADDIAAWTRQCAGR